MTNLVVMTIYYTLVTCFIASTIVAVFVVRSALRERRSARRNTRAEPSGSRSD